MKKRERLDRVAFAVLSCLGLWILSSVSAAGAGHDVVRYEGWSGMDAWIKGRGFVGKASDTQLEGFKVENAAARIRGERPPHRFTYTFDRAGRLYAALQVVDDVDGVEELLVTLNGKGVGRIIADRPRGGYSLFSFRKPFDVKPGDKLSFACRTRVGYYRVDRLFFSREPIVPPRPEFRNIEVWSPAAGQVHLCWTTSMPVETGAVEYGVGDAFDHKTERAKARGRNHRVRLTGLDPTKEYQARIVSRYGDEALRSTIVTFRARPPVPGPTKPFGIALIVAEALRQGAPNGGFILSPCATPYERPLPVKASRNLIHYLKMGRKYGTY